MDEIKFITMGYNDYYGWLYTIHSCTKEIPEKFINRHGRWLDDKERRELIALLAPVRAQYAHYNPFVANEKLQYS
jgi:hypothetical protein